MSDPAPLALAEEAPPVFFDAVLHPHRSLPPRAFGLMMAFLGGVSFFVSVGFVLIGAWPITGFFGLDVLLLYIAFRLSYRSARLHEHVRLTEGDLSVERVDVYGERLHWQFQPYWLRVILEEPDEDSNRLLLTSHGRTLVLASFLGPAERRQLAMQLKDALVRWRRFITSG